MDINGYLQALSCDHPTVVLEIVLGMEALVSKSGASLQCIVWDNILKILKRCVEYVSKYLLLKITIYCYFIDVLKLRIVVLTIIIWLDGNEVNSTAMIADHLNGTITNIELLVSTDDYSGNLDGLYDVIEIFSLYRPVSYSFTFKIVKYACVLCVLGFFVLTLILNCYLLIIIFIQESSVLNLIAYRKEFLVSTQYQWINKLKMFLSHFYSKENRTLIRIHAVTKIMKEVYKQNRLVL